MTSFSDLRQRAGLSIRDVAERMGRSERTVYRWEGGISAPLKPAIDLLNNLADRSKSHAASFRFVDLFAGIGGFRRAFEPLGGRCVFTSEWDRFSQVTYRANYKLDHELAGDITVVDADQIPKHEMLLAGFPCQPFSLAGVSKKNS